MLKLLVWQQLKCSSIFQSIVVQRFSIEWKNSSKSFKTRWCGCCAMSMCSQLSLVFYSSVCKILLSWMGFCHIQYWLRRCLSLLSFWVKHCSKDSKLNLHMTCPLHFLWWLTVSVAHWFSVFLLSIKLSSSITCWWLSFAWRWADAAQPVVLNKESFWGSLASSVIQERFFCLCFRSRETVLLFNRNFEKLWLDASVLHW